MTFTSKFVLVFLSRTLSIYRTPEEGGRYLFNSSLLLPPATQTISRAITVESLPLHIASSQTQTGNLTYTLFIIHIYCIYIYTCTYTYIYYIYKCIVSIPYTVEKKRKCSYNSQCHGNMEISYYQVIRNLIILSLCPFSKISHPP